MKKITCICIVMLTCLAYTIPAQADVKKLAQTGLQFLKVDVGPRAAAMGGAYAMVGHDVSAVFYNPAGIAHMQNDWEILATQTQWIADITYSAGAVAKNFGNWGIVGLNVINCDYGEITGTRVSTTEAGFERTGSVDVGAYSVGLTYARQVSQKFAVGGQVKLAAQHLGSSVIDSRGTEHENKVSGVAYDFGTVFYPGFRSFRLGMFIRNFSPQFKYEKEAFQLPLTFTIGAAMDVLEWFEIESSSLLLSVDALHPRDYTERIHAGAEYTFMDMIALRAGYKFNYDEEGLTAGLGFKTSLSGFNVDIGYSYSEFGVFSAVNRFALSLAF